MAKRITFDTNIIETLYTSLRQSQSIVWRNPKEWHIRIKMDDVDYLVEDNVRNDFCLSSEMDGTHGRTTFEEDPEQ